MDYSRETICVLTWDVVIQTKPITPFVSVHYFAEQNIQPKDFGRDENEVEEDEEVDEVSKVPVSNCCSKN